MIRDMPFTRSLRLLVVVAVAGNAACAKPFNPASFQTQDALYQAALREYQRRHWENAIAAFERLTTELPARDPLMPLAMYYLGKSHVGKRENLLAAQSFVRLAESFPNDTLADDGLLEAGRAYARMWRKPALDAQYGETALSTLRTMVSLYPNSPLAPEAQREIARLNEWFATKLFETGVHYQRRKAPDSAIIYFRDVVRLYPDTQRARDALVRLVEVYRSINYRAEATETCDTLRRSYPADRRVIELCGAQRADGTPAARP
jgi:outer membrane protein assembly factor BamD